MKKIIYLMLLIAISVTSTAFAAQWSSLNVPRKSTSDALIEQKYAVDRLVALTSYEKDKLNGIYFWRMEKYSRPDVGKGQINYRIYFSFLDLRKKPWRIQDSLLYTNIQWEPAVFEKNREWVMRGTVTENPNNDKIAKQVIDKANELVKKGKLESKNIPIRLQTLPVPKDMQ